jgi:hypothetical protein
MDFDIHPIIPLRFVAQTGYAIADRFQQKTPTLDYAPEIMRLKKSFCRWLRQ